MKKSMERSVTTLKYSNDASYLVPKKGRLFRKFLSYIKRYWPLYLMVLPVIAYLFIFSYIPMGGLTLAFKDFNKWDGIWNSPWATNDLGELDLFKHFRILFEDPRWWESFGTTMKISLLRLVFGFFVPIVLTILLSEMKSKKYSKVFQIVSYLPHFISWIVIYGILTALTASRGEFQNFLSSIFGSEVRFLSDPNIFTGLVIFSNIWKEAGWSTIIYFAAIASISPDLYEAADIDGATRWQKIVNITIPGMIPAISINLILQASSFVYGGFDQIFAMTANGSNLAVSDYVNISEMFLFEAGITNQQYELATVVGLFNSVISFVLVLGANKIIKLIGGDGLW